MRALSSISLRVLLVTGICVALGVLVSRIPQVDRIPGGDLSILLIAVGVGLLFSYQLIVRPLSRRLDRLSRIAKRLGKADKKIVADETRDEVGDVSRALFEAHQRMLDHERLLGAQYQALRMKQINMAHDLRTPLTTLLLALENARDAAGAPQGDQEDPADFIRAAMSEALYLTSLVQNLRIASRMDAGFASLGARAKLDLIELIQRVANRFTLLAKGSGTEVHISHPDDPVIVEGDDTMIEQLVTNLVQNSLSYGGEDQQVVIRLDAADGRFTMDVLDEGPGIAEDSIGSILERGVRGPGRDERSKSGQGLGLAIVSEVAVVHDWKLSLVNREERGLRARVEGVTAPK